MWVFSRLPEKEWDNVKGYFEKRNELELIKIHNKYTLSTYEYCCKGIIFKWIEHGLEYYWNDSKRTIR